MARLTTLLGGALLAALLAGCGGARTVSLADLATEAERYDGSAIVVSGVVAEFGEEEGALERHFVIQDDEANRVQLVPNAQAEPHVGQVVTVEGQFSYDERSGRILEVDRITPAGG